MACSKCGSIPDFPCGVCIVYINTSMDELFTKITNLLQSNWKTGIINDDYLELQVDDFQTFICTLSLMTELTHKEATAINTLPLHPDESLNFTTYSNTKPLSKWISLLKAGELIDILNHKRLVTFFQPIIDVKDNSIYGYELLSRGIKKMAALCPHLICLPLPARVI